MQLVVAGRRGLSLCRRHAVVVVVVAVVVSAAVAALAAAGVGVGAEWLGAAA